MKKSFQRNGMALFVVLIMLSLLGLLFGVGARGGAMSLTTGNLSNERNEAYFVAYGALQRALLELRADSTWAGTAGTKFPGPEKHKYDVTVFENTTGAPMPTPAGVDLPPGEKLVLASCRIGSVERKIAGLITQAPSGSEGFAALTNGDMDLFGAKIGAFDAPNGFGLADMVMNPGKAQVGSVNARVDIKARNIIPPLPAQIDGVVASERVDGDSNTADPGAYTIDATSSLGGETQLSAPPSPAFPASPAYLGGPSVVHDTGCLTIGPGHYDQIMVRNDGELTLEPGEYFINGDLSAWDTSRVYTNGAVRIFVNGAMKTNQTSSFNHESDPRDCEIFIEGDGADWAGLISNESHVWARLKAPDSRLTVSGTIYGDVQLDQLVVRGDHDGSGAIYFFTDLSTSTTVSSSTGNEVYSTIWTVQ